MSERMQRQVVVHMPEEMHAALVEDAAANGRTVAQEIRHIIRNSWLDILPPLKVGGP